MKKAKFILDKDYSIGEVEPRLFGSFIEHLGRAVYSGIYEPGHPSADEHGFREDVLNTVKELNVPVVRYPGGNFVSGYNWMDGIGPKEQRPKRLELAWFSLESNQVGIDEFADWCKKAECEPMLAVNLGTGTPEQAGHLVEYCNHPSGTEFSDLRRKYGHENPHNIKTWCLGNEMDGPWQICHLSADDYGKKALEAAKIMRWVDPSIELVACGSSMPEMDTYPVWDRVVLEHLYEQVDYLSLHNYYEYKGNIEDFLFSHIDMDNYIKAAVSTADYVKAKTRSKKQMKLSFDEWNVWYSSHWEKRKPSFKRWQTAPDLMEDKYTVLDALVVGGLLCTLLNNSDRVKMACLAQLVNALAPITTRENGDLIKHTIFYPFQHVSLYGRGTAMKPVLKCSTIETGSFGETPILQSAATYNEEDSSLCIFVLNCDKDNPVEMTMDLRCFGSTYIHEHIILDSEDLFAINSFDSPERVVPRTVREDSESHGDLTVLLPKLSWNVIRLRQK